MPQACQCLKGSLLFFFFLLTLETCSLEHVLSETAANFSFKPM